MNLPVFPLAVPRRLLVTLKLGEVPEHLPSVLACKRYGVRRADKIDRGTLDRVLRHFGGAARSARLHNSRLRASQKPGVSGARRFDQTEQLSGVARVIRVELQNDVNLSELSDALAQVPVVERVQMDRLCGTPFDSPVEQIAAAQIDQDQAWRSRQLVRLPQALGFEPGDPAVVMGLADTGVVSSHLELSGNIRRGFDSVDLNQAMVGDLELVGDNQIKDELPFDEVGHGTACASILSARGVQLPPGGAGQCGLTPVRVLGAGLVGQKRVGIGALSNIDVGMKRLIDLGVKVINMSFGTAKSDLASDAPLPHQEVVDYALAREVILVAAGGNSGLAESYYPAAHTGVIAVGAVDDFAKPCRFSTRGEHIALSAPGKKIWSAGLNDYQQVTGTSFAAPFVAAVCTLMAAHARRRALPLRVSLVKEILIRSTRPFSTAGVEGFGAGVLDGLAALQLLSRSLDDMNYQAGADYVAANG